MKKLLLLTVIVFILVAHSISAYTYINIYLDNLGNAQFLGETNETNTTLNLPAGVLVQNGKIQGTTPNLTVKTGDIWIFAYYLQGADLKVILPDGAVIETLNNGEVYLERGKISVYFVNKADLTYTIQPPQTLDTIIAVLGITLFVLISGVIFFLIFRKKRASLLRSREVYKRRQEILEERKIELIKEVLNPREKIIIEKLEKHKKIKMSYLRKLSEIPKASFSRHVQELERKGLLKKTGEGKNKFVELAK